MALTLCRTALHFSGTQIFVVFMSENRLKILTVDGREQDEVSLKSVKTPKRLK